MDADRALAELQQQGPSPSTSSDSQEEETALLPRYTKVSVVGNNRTKQSLIGKKGIVKKAVGLGGWHLLVSTFRRVQNLGILRPGAWEVAGDAVHGQLWSRRWAWELQAYCCVLRRGCYWRLWCQKKTSTFNGRPALPTSSCQWTAGAAPLPHRCSRRARRCGCNEMRSQCWSIPRERSR